jgi:hypothetical protein
MESLILSPVPFYTQAPFLLLRASWFPLSPLLLPIREFSFSFTSRISSSTKVCGSISLSWSLLFSYLEQSEQSLWNHTKTFLV